MNTHCRPPLGGGPRWWTLFALVWLTVASGCLEPTVEAPSNEDMQSARDVANWYSKFRQDTGKPPANEAEFIAFIERLLQERGQTLDKDKLLTSPRDGKKFVITYGKPTSTNPDKNVVVQEQEGVDGKKLIGVEQGYADLVDDAKLQSMLAGE